MRNPFGGFRRFFAPDGAGGGNAGGNSGEEPDEDPFNRGEREDEGTTVIGPESEEGSTDEPFVENGDGDFFTRGEDEISEQGTPGSNDTVVDDEGGESARESGGEPGDSEDMEAGTSFDELREEYERGGSAEEDEGAESPSGEDDADAGAEEGFDATTDDGGDEPFDDPLGDVDIEDIGSDSSTEGTSEEVGEEDDAFGTDFEEEESGGDEGIGVEDLDLDHEGGREVSDRAGEGGEGDEEPETGEGTGPGTLDRQLSELDRVSENLIYSHLEDWEDDLGSLREATVAYRDGLEFETSDTREEMLDVLAHLYTETGPSRADLASVADRKEGVTEILTDYVDTTLENGGYDRTQIYATEHTDSFDTMEGLSNDQTNLGILAEVDSKLEHTPHQDAILQHAEDGTTYTEELEEAVNAAVDGVRKTLFAARYWNRQEDRIDDGMVEDLEDLDSFTDDRSFAHRNREELYEIAQAGREITEQATEKVSDLLSTAESWKDLFDTHHLDRAASEYGLDTLEDIGEAYKEAVEVAGDMAGAMDGLTAFAELPDSTPTTEYEDLRELEEGALYMEEVADSVAESLEGYGDGVREGNYGKAEVEDVVPTANSTVVDLGTLSRHAREVHDYVR
ncbi:MAG: hypothetical protein SVQ76_01320 [Candidatus Nanohaloarchaea archaeon]|nr:hypothetical protein [Candidatus Nanohaloarchaea archaeon]